MSYHYDEVYSVYDEVFPKAVKTHVCDACNETIPVGRRYARVAIIFDGSVETVKRCMRCQDLHQHLRKLGSETWPHERLACGKGYEEEWGEPPPEHVAALAFALPGETPEETRKALGIETPATAEGARA